jgi:hypothetical protein
LAAIVKSIVTVADRPSGTQATKTPIAKLIAKDAFLLFTGKAIPKKMRAVIMAMVAISFTKLSISWARSHPE